MTLETSLEEIRKATLTRGTLYKFLSRSFSLEADEAYLEWVMQLHPMIVKVSTQIDTEDFKNGSERLQKFIDDVKAYYEKDKSLFLQNLAAEYASLFLNVGAIHVYLAESAYLGTHSRGQKALLYEEPYFDVLRMYELYGFEKSKFFKEPEDHVAIELEFMAHLCDLASRSIKEGNKEYALGFMKNQVEFLDLHLSKWMPLLVERLRKASMNDLYLALGDLLIGFISADRETASEFVEQLSGSLSSV